LNPIPIPIAIALRFILLLGKLIFLLCFALLCFHFYLVAWSSELGAEHQRQSLNVPANERFKLLPTNLLALKELQQPGVRAGRQMMANNGTPIPRTKQSSRIHDIMVWNRIQ